MQQAAHREKLKQASALQNPSGSSGYLVERCVITIVGAGFWGGRGGDILRERGGEDIGLLAM